MGHFGSRPIRLAWSLMVFPSLLLNYAGQGALVLEGAPISDNIFYRLCPSSLLIPMIVLATVATVIASQSIITGAFSMTRQAIQLGWLPLMRIVQTSEEGYGQIYVGAVNWLLMAVTIGLTISFGKSDNLAAAYGIAVSATMLMTSALLFIAMREVWGWNVMVAGLAAGSFMLVDVAFFVANCDKIFEGGYVPLVLATAVYGVMYLWHRGVGAIERAATDEVVPVADFMDEIAKAGIPRVPGTAVFLTRTSDHTPPVMIWHVRHNRALHERLLVVRTVTKSIPWVGVSERLALDQVAPGFWRATANFGFMERPDIPALLTTAKALGCQIDPSDVTYYLGHDTVVGREDGKGLPGWQRAVFQAMQRNAVRTTDFFRLPSDAVVEIGRQVAI
jgi:KUP system potassium uptake protein